MRILSLFDFTGYALAPWTAAGHHTIAVDILHGNLAPIPSGPHFSESISLDLSKRNAIATLKKLQPDLVLGFPPCTDLAVSGAKHFQSKLARDPHCQTNAVKMARLVERLGNALDIPWMVENPVGVMSTLWRAPDWFFHPYQYAGFLPEDDVHPDWPKYIPARDQYPKKTCIWCGNGFEMPEAVPVNLVTSTGESLPFEKFKHSSDGQRYAETFFRLGGKSIKTKTIRSATPRGFAEAVFQVNER
jgi:hypothetical protein